MLYAYTKQISTNDFSESNIEALYNQGYVFTRLGRGVMNQVRSLRVNIKKFSLMSENKRVLKKTEHVDCSFETLPYKSYHWSIGKMALDFYSQKFGDGVISANKIKELFTDPERSNMNAVFTYRIQDEAIGFCPVYQTKNIVHYAYPFYSLLTTHYSLGMSMMTKAIILSQEQRKQFVYLGSVQGERAIYKLQFKGLEWWDVDHWNTDLHQLKEIVSSALPTSSME